MRKSVKGMAVGLLTMSMLVSAPAMAYAGQANGAANDVAITT